ncbi:hypothetical protein Q5P01_004957 [Channa striata]|uniref:Uncharacterized protein n=1 Tax=Channa striata TaxID=64152 RepID=A0AA88NFM6_CHASR|nr:hypothetical protein Q5P01_004957 [Channa striata]
MQPKSLPSRLFGRNPAAAAAASCESLSGQAAKYQRQVDCEDQLDSQCQSACNDKQQVGNGSKQSKKCHRGKHFFVDEHYEPLLDDEVQGKAKEEKKKRRKEKYKKVKKNMGKAWRCTWKCLMLGLYNFALGYSTPITMAATFVPDFHPGSNMT